jgi:hypothetical protein
MERCKHQKRGCIEGKSTKRMKVQKAREGMHTYNIYIQSLQAVQGGNQHPDSTPEDAMLPSLIALPLFANRLVRKGERDGDSRPGCSRQSSGGPAPVVSDIEGCMRCRSVSGAAKLFAVAVLPEHESNHSYTVSTSTRLPHSKQRTLHVSTSDCDQRVLVPGRVRSAPMLYELTVKLIAAVGASSGLHQRLHILITGQWPHTNHLCGLCGSLR